MKKKVVIIGGGAAGMLAAIAAAGNGHEVHVLEKNEKLGKKLFITGKGRCNVTNDCDIQTFLDHMPGNGKFLYSAYKAFTSADVQAWFEENGVPLKVERGNRVFPESDRSQDIVSCMERQLRKAGTKVEFLSEVTEILCTGEKVIGVSVGSRMHFADAVLVATGGAARVAAGREIPVDAAIVGIVDTES